MSEDIFISFTIGFLAASPGGPMGLLCMRRAMIQGFLAGLYSALGIALAYLFWAYVALHGLGAISHWIEREHRPLQIGIGLLLVGYGLLALFKPSANCTKVPKKGSWAGFVSTFLVVFLNPATLLALTLLFTYFGIAKRHSGALDSLIIAFSVFIGAITFWMAVSYSIQKARNKITDTVFKRISHLSALGILAFGVIMFWCAP